MFSMNLAVRFRDCDPAGILFFARTFELAHDSYEDFVAHLGFSRADWFDSTEFAVPIRHSECEHLLPLRAGNSIQIKVAVLRVGDSSFSLKYTFEVAGLRCCEVTLVHAFMDRRTFAKISIPLKIRERLEAYQRESVSP